MNIAQYIRPDILALTPYTSARDEFDGKAAIYLDANENALDPLKLSYNRYPHPDYRELKIAIGQWRNVTPERIFVGNGSDEAIDLLIRATCTPGKDAIMVLPPTYGMYAVQAQIQGVRVKEVLLTPEFQPDVDAILKSATPDVRLLFLCSPNNPTGNTMDVERVTALLRQFSGIVVVDEAYIDFADTTSWLQQLEKFPNLVVLQTFSKALGLAGIRLGMAFAHPEVVAVLNKIKYPYNVNRLTVQMALQALGLQQAIQESIQQLRTQRKWLASALQQMSGVRTIYPSQANFLLVEFQRAREVYQALQKKGIIVRDRSKLPRCQNCLRITVGTPKENHQLIQALQEILKENETRIVY